MNDECYQAMIASYRRVGIDTLKSALIGAERNTDGRFGRAVGPLAAVFCTICVDPGPMAYYHEASIAFDRKQVEHYTPEEWDEAMRLAIGSYVSDMRGGSR